MYNFIDVNEASESVVLPSEALKINGKYIEDQISGYRTLSVQGREAHSPDVTTFETGVRDGSEIQSKRYPQRIIVVTYQISAKTNEEFREAYNQLGRILDVKDAELIFNDEPDKYFIGTPCIIEAVTPGRNNVVGTFEIVCTDPFKYSCTEYEATPNLEDGSILINYGGTYRAFPVLEADFFKEEENGETETTLTGDGDCGYVAFFNENEKIIQLGDPEESDTEGAYPKSQTMMNQTFMGSTAWGTTAKKHWAVNSGVVMPAGKVVEDGNVKMGIAATAQPAKAGTTTAKILNKMGDPQFEPGIPMVRYSLTAKTTSRAANSVYVSFVLECYCDPLHPVPRGAVITAYVQVGGVWYTQPVKNEGSVEWAAGSTKSFTFGYKISGLTENTTSLTGIVFKAEGNNGGSLKATACQNIPVASYTPSTPSEYYLTASGYGTYSGTWHGPSITRQVGADKAGEVGAANFTLTYKQKMCIGKASKATDQKGAFQMMLSANDGTVVAGIRIIKSASGKSGNLVFYVNGNQVNTTKIDLHYNNTYFGSSEKSVKTTTVTKSGGTITFAVGSYKRQYYVDALADVKVTKVTFAFEKYSALATLEYNGLYWAKFVKNNCQTFKDIPNKFSANDVVEADCKNGDILLNGIARPELGALGNDWEEFYLVPGLNQIGIAYSDWVQEGCEPTIKVRYREVFL